MEKQLQKTQGKGGTLYHADMKYTLESLKELVPNPQRMAAIEEAMGRYDQPHANSLAECIVSVSRNNPAKARVIDEFLGFVSEGEVAKFIGKTSADVAGRQASELLAISKRTNDLELMSTIMKTVLATAGPKRGEGHGYRDEVAVIETINAVSERFGNKDTVTAACRTLSEYRGAAAENIAVQIRSFTGDRRRSAESAGAFLALFAIPELARLLEQYGQSRFVGEFLNDLTKHAKRRLHRKNLDKAFEEESAYVTALASRLTSSEVVDAVRKFDEKEGSYSYGAGRVHAILYGMARTVQTDAPLLEFARAIAAFDCNAAQDIARRFERVWDELRKDGDKKRAVTDAELSRLIKLFSGGGRDFSEAFDTDTVVEMLEKGLDAVVSDRNTFRIVGTYLESDSILPAPTQENIGRYEEMANDALKRRYGLERKLTMDQVELLFSFDNYHGGQEAMRQGAVHFVNVSEEGNARFYSIDQPGQSKRIDYSREQLRKYAVLTIMGAREEGAEPEAAITQVVGAKAVANARNEFNARHRRLMQELIGAVKQSDYERAFGILSGTGEEYISDVLNAAEYRETMMGNSKLMKASESKNPLDYDSRLQIACVYLPQGAHIFEYCTDDRITLVKYEIGGRAVGSAICYMEDGVFLVDSVEGHRTFRKPEVYEAVYNDIVERARAKGARLIIFSTDANNQTPNEFEEYIKKGKGLRKSEVKMKLETPTYLEAGEDGVSGLVLDLSRPELAEAAKLDGVLRKG